MRRTIPLLLVLLSAFAQGQDEPLSRSLTVARVLSQVGEKEKAARWLRTLRRQSLGEKAGPDEIHLRRRLADLLHKVDPIALRYEKADPDDRESVLKMARAYMNKGWFDAANEVIGTASGLDPQSSTELRSELSKRKQKYGERRSRSPLQEAIDRGLDWLLRHQQKDGRWVARGKNDNIGYPLYDVGVTGLAVLCLSKEKYAKNQGRYDAAARKAIAFLLKSQDPMGCFGQQVAHFMYGHCICTQVICNAFERSGDERLRIASKEAVAFLLHAQNRQEKHGFPIAWRYTVQPGDNDTSVTGWAVWALVSAEAAGIPVPHAALKGARIWVDQMMDPATGRIGYQSSGISPARIEDRKKLWPPKKSEAITAVALGIRACLGEDPRKSKYFRMGVELCRERLPSWNPKDGSIDFYYWYFGTRALLLAGGTPWKKWRTALEKAILPHQLREGEHRGSWEPLGPWCADGGRVYVTTMLTMALQTARATGRH